MLTMAYITRGTGFALLLALLGFHWHNTRLEFPSEVIAVQLTPGAYEVDARYDFRNPGAAPIMKAVLLPYVQAANTPPAELLALVPDAGNLHSLNLGRRGNAWLTLLYVPPGTHSLRLHYRQPTESRQGSYILTTTATWDAPLESGVYTLSAKGVTLRDSNYPLEPGDSGQFHFEEQDFMPPKDWEFSWD